MCGKSRQPSPSRRPAGIDKHGMAWNHVLLIHTDAKEPDVKAIVLSVFLGGLAVCVLTGASVLWALLLGLACFAGYALRQGHAPRDVALMLWSGVRSVRNILIIFGLIGMLTAVWRASGTLPFIIHHTLQWVDPAYFILWVFLLCCLLSLLLGTAFGSVSTLGVIFMMLARSAGLDELATAGAIMSGIYVGDRCSPVSSSAALVCALTNTNIYANMRRMWTTSALPFALTCAGYLALSLSGPARLAAPDAAGQLDRFFILSGWTLLPAACIVVLSLFRADVKQAMFWSILAGGAVCLTVQGMEPGELFACLAFGYTPAPGAEILAGGGIRSMLQVAGIVLLSSSYSGIFDATDLLSGFGGLIRRLAERIGTFRAMTLASVPVSGISCNQTLATILTAQLCRPCYARRQDMAIPLENSAILIAALIPWSIAGSLPCATLGVTMACLPYALYLYLVPLANALRKDPGPDGPEPATSI
ncbi:Na+/H+ antiporter NhaC family protein [Bilophila wadsworthia]